MTMDNAIVYCRVLNESMSHIRNSFSMDVLAGKVCELLDREFTPNILNDSILFSVSYGRDRAYA
jgi:hypothetical protein